MGELTCLEIGAGAGGQSLGLEDAGFRHVAAVEIDRDACETLSLNRRSWHPVQMDLHDFDGKPFRGTDLLSGGVPVPVLYRNKQLGADDERDLFPQALRLVEECTPVAGRRMSAVWRPGALSVIASRSWLGLRVWVTRSCGRCSTPASSGCPSSGHVHPGCSRSGGCPLFPVAERRGQAADCRRDPA